MNTNQTTQSQSVKDFCAAHSISLSMFYKLQRAGQAPRVMKVGRRTLITADAAHDWRKQMEVPA